MDNTDHIGQRIKIRRLELNLTQDELAKRVGYKSRTSINKIELARSLPLSKVEKMANALEVSPSYLMGWEDNKSFSIMQSYTCNLNIKNNPVMVYIEPMISGNGNTSQCNPNDIIQIMHYLTKLNDKGIDDVVRYLRLMVNSGEYKKEE